MIRANRGNGARVPEFAFLLQRFAEEAAFLWLKRDHAVRAPHYSLGDIVKLDERVEAHLDGLRVAYELLFFKTRGNGPHHTRHACAETIGCPALQPKAL